ncbi:hypothetical protein FB45DRAFT_940142 [Roridomyces roridus]|uniref:F-box domain-containing protein n=1 Tax=Roridomyces roridus TaxID=1738132 RepID=A0AAD7B6T7_9AGAR|nr:hypothetical protein FB45DRAFT_940142 [Roridomyces roridus]
MSSVASGLPGTLRARLAEIDAETALLHTRLALLAAERKPLVQALQSVIYPAVLDIPPEITAEIFLQYVTTAQIGGDNPTIPHAPGWVAPCGPLVLASICRRWREIALSLQPIWSRFRIKTSSDGLESVARLLEHWLPRAGDHPLVVYLAGWNNVHLIPLGRNLINLHTLHCSFNSLTGFPNQLVQGRIPNLRRLEITGENVDGPGPATPITAFIDCLQLREVALYACLRPWISLPWDRLTRLELTELYNDQCIDILQSTPAVESLTLFLVNVPDPHFAAAPVRLPHLHTIKIDKYQTYVDIFRALDAPSLTHIEFSLSPTEDLPPLMSTKALDFIGLIQRSACHLRSITLFRARLYECVECLGAAGSSLAVVKMQEIEWHGEQFKHFFRAFQVDAAAPLVPNLTSLSLNPCVVAVNVPYVELAAMLASRRGRDTRDGTVARLESFELVLDDTSSWPNPTLAEMDESLDALRALQADGLDLNLRVLQKMSQMATMDAAAVYPPPPDWLDENSIVVREVRRPQI